MSALSNQDPNAAASDFNLFQTYFAAAIAGVQTVSLVRVESCTNAGGIVPAGTVDVTVLVNIMSANRSAIPHGIISGLPYSRIQGGANAVIIDPQPGDIGIALFCSRDISIVKKTKARANPGSYRTFDWADGLYIGGLLNATPAQYIAFVAGITMGTPVVTTTQNLSVGTGASATLTDSTGKVGTFQNGILVNVA